MSITCEPALDGVDVGQVVELRRRRDLARVGIVDAIDAVLRHQEGFAVDLDGAQGGRRVGRHEGLPVPAAKMTTRPFSRWRIARRRM